jgi:hypothetical protein
MVRSHAERYQCAMDYLENDGASESAEDDDDDDSLSDN